MTTPEAFDRLASATVDDNALAIARALYRLADDWEAAFAVRHRSGAHALGAWSGPASERFAERLWAERTRSDQLCSQLRSEAAQWNQTAAIVTPGPGAR